jgi:hypothetical protein
MPLNWDRFLELDGAPDRNFEVLCRAIVQQNYGRFGAIWSTRQQPGVEFYMRLERDCELGEAGRYFGWQTRWYQLRADNSFRAAQREGIVDAIRKAEAHIADLTDFVLCLRELPTADDVTWYREIDTRLNLHLWADEEIDARLTGEAAVLRETFFGELVLTGVKLAASHERAVAPVRHRWVPELNVASAAQNDLQIALARRNGLSELHEHGEALHELAARLADAAAEIDVPHLRDLCAGVVADLNVMSNRLRAIAANQEGDGPREARELAEQHLEPVTPVARIRLFARRMRARKVSAALDASAVEPELRHGLTLLRRARDLLFADLIAVVGDAGSGKSHLAAQLTAPSGDAPAGVFILAGDRGAGQTLDDLAARVPELGVGSFDRLLEAVDAAGARLGWRIPIVLDGLNDSERPQEWQALLATLAPALTRHPNALVVVTLRPSLRDDVPAEARRLELGWSESEVEELIEKYFAYYIIEPGSARLPIYLFREPLFLRMFCEAVNPDREQPVGVERLPGSLVAAFTLYLTSVADRLARQHEWAPTYVSRQLAKIALELWNRNARRMPFHDLQQLIGEDERQWRDSLVRALEDEGILWRHDRVPGDQESAIIFDAFTGYLIADALLRELSPDVAADFLASPELWEKLTGDTERRHPVAPDIFEALVGIVPRQLHGQQLWKIAPEPMSRAALIATVTLESELLDAETVRTLSELIATRSPVPSSHRLHVFDRLWEVRDGAAHRLNARFLDQTLRAMPLAARDLRWSEWIRIRGSEMFDDIVTAEEHWTASDSRAEADDLLALAIAWLLTSSVTQVRDTATRALCRYGVPDPRKLFDLCAQLLDVDDMYVAERVLAASYGAATHHQMPDPGGPFERALSAHLEVLASRFVGAAATSPTSHQLARDYIAGTFEFAARLHPQAVPEGMDGTNVQLGSGPEPPSLPEGEELISEMDEIFYGTDFSNYVVGGLYPERGNYDFDHPQYQAGLEAIRARVYELGWRSDSFTEIDRHIAEESWRRQERGARTERYGKKYGWIAYHELAGRLGDRGELRDPGWGPVVWPDIDPTFPVPPSAAPIDIATWATAEPVQQEDWVRGGVVAITNDLLAPAELAGLPGPWILVEAHLYQRNREVSRRVFGFVRGLLIASEACDDLVQILEGREYLGNDFVPSVPEDHTTFAGEIPWSERFAADLWIEEGLEAYEHRLQQRDGTGAGITIELLGHRYAFSSERTDTGLEHYFNVPSKRFASTFGLRQRPATFDLVELDGRAASLARAAPECFEGDLLYLRRDLLAAYAHGRRLVQLVWGERELDLYGERPPEWLRRVYQEGTDRWRHVETVTLG